MARVVLITLHCITLVLHALQSQRSSSGLEFRIEPHAATAATWQPLGNSGALVTQDRQMQADPYYRQQDSHMQPPEVASESYVGPYPQLLQNAPNSLTLPNQSAPQPSPLGATAYGNPGGQPAPSAQAAHYPSRQTDFDWGTRSEQSPHYPNNRFPHRL